MKARKVSVNIFKEAKHSKSEVADLLVEKYNVSVKLARKISRHVGIDRLRDVEKMDESALKDLISGSTLEIKKASDEMDQNKNLIEAQDVIKTLRGGLRDTVTPFQASISLASVLLEIKKDSAT